MESFVKDKNTFVSEIRKLRIPYLLQTSLIVVIALVFVLTGFIYGSKFVSSYGNEKHAAELAREVERKEFEKWKSEQEAEIAGRKAQIEADGIAQKKANENLLNVERNSIATKAVSDYKASDTCLEDSCKLVASSISKVKTGYYLYKYMRSDDIKQWQDLKLFYKNYLYESYDQYLHPEKYKK